MSESESHKRAKKKAPGEEEVKLPDNRRLDSASEKTATEVERSETQERLMKAIKRLIDSGKKRRILQVPDQNLKNAMDAVKKSRAKITVQNLSKTKTKYPRKK